MFNNQKTRRDAKKKNAPKKKKVLPKPKLQTSNRFNQQPFKTNTKKNDTRNVVNTKRKFPFFSRNKHADQPNGGKSNKTGGLKQTNDNPSPNFARAKLKLIKILASA